MSEPVYSQVTEDLYVSLPQVQRQQDALQAPAWPLKKWVSGIADQVGEISQLVEEIDYYPPDEAEDPSEDVSTLVDPATARVAWLPWLGQLLGTEVDPGQPEQAQRDTVSGAAGGFRGGTRRALAAAVAAELTGGRHVRVASHTTASGTVGSAGQWDVCLITLASETPSGLDLPAVAVARGAKPAGVMLHHRVVATTWDDLASDLPTWADWEGKSWDEIEESGL